MVVQLLCCVQLFATWWTAASQACLSFTVSQNLLKLMSIESVMPPNHLILCFPLLLLPSVSPSIRIFSNESALHYASKTHTHTYTHTHTPKSKNSHEGGKGPNSNGQ